MSCCMLIRSGICQSAAEALTLYDATRVDNNRGLTVTSQRKMVIFYEKLWRDHWKVTGNIGDIPGEPVGSTKWVVPTQPKYHLVGVEVTNVNGEPLKNLRFKVFKGTSFAPELRDVVISKNGGMVACDCFIEGNFKILVEKSGLWGYKKVFEMWHNTLFLDTSSSTIIDFGLDQLDVKKKVKAILGPNIVLRLSFGSAGAPIVEPSPFSRRESIPQTQKRPSTSGAASKGGAYEMVSTHDVDVGLNDVKEDSKL